MSLIRLTDMFESINTLNSVYSIDESVSESKVDGVNVLAKVSGPFFAVNSESLNKRFYSKKLWERALNETSDKVKTGEMAGTIGHDLVLDDKAFREGLVSHKVTKLWINESDDGVGMGEVLILNTEVGRRLNSYFRSGTPLAISSRAFGEFKSKTKTGSDIINEDTFVLEGFDFTRNPGITKARPALVETLNSEVESEVGSDADDNSSYTDEINDEPPVIEVTPKIAETKLKPKSEPRINSLPSEGKNLTSTTSIKESKMEREIIESLTKEKLSLQNSLGESLGKIKTFEYDLTNVQRTLESKQKEIEITQAKLNDAERKIEDLSSRVEESAIRLSQFNKLGSFDEVSTSLSTLRKVLESYKELGTVQELKNTISKLQRVTNESKVISLQEAEELNEYRRIGSLDEMTKAIEVLETYQQYGNFEELDQICALTEEYMSLGTPNEINEMCDIIEEYSDLGSIDEINIMCDVVESYATLGSVDEIKAVFQITEGYSNLGSPDEINTAFDLVEEYVESSKTKSANEGADQLASTYGLPFDTVRPLVEKLGKEEAIRTIEAMNESNNVVSRYRKEADSERSAIIENTPVGGNRISRLFESHLR